MESCFEWIMAHRGGMKQVGVSWWESDFLPRVVRNVYKFISDSHPTHGKRGPQNFSVEPNPEFAFTETWWVVVNLNDWSLNPLTTCTWNESARVLSHNQVGQRDRIYPFVSVGSYGPVGERWNSETVWSAFCLKERRSGVALLTLNGTFFHLSSWPRCLSHLGLPDVSKTDITQSSLGISEFFSTISFKV